MTLETEKAALQHALELCRGHKAALGDALADIEQRTWGAAELDHLAKADRRLLDQFAYRYTRLQDDMGHRLIPAAPRALGEEIGPMPVLDRLNRLEQLRWLPSAEEWTELRRIRNEFTHEYPAASPERLERLELARHSAHRLVEILGIMDRRAREYGLA